MPRQKRSLEVVKPAIEIDEDLKLHERGWVVQRVGWLFILAVMLAGILGLFGEGFLSRKTATAGNIQTEYEQYFRYEAEMAIKIKSQNEHISTISLPQDYLKDFRIIRFIPEPLHNSTIGTDVVYNFQPASNQTVTVYLIPKTNGSLDGVMKVNGSNSIPLHHYIYP